MSAKDAGRFVLLGFILLGVMLAGLLAVSPALATIGVLGVFAYVLFILLKYKD